MKKFRNDINGLRAIAVISVVLFHFNPTLLPGGFSGVDIFFVISGFLMTNIIFTGLKECNFSILEFYKARANRIIPPLLALTICLIIFGWFYLTPIDYTSLAKHIASSLLFVSNLIYWSEAGYFDGASIEKWLLHTWSLSVEWQFYLLYPVFLVLLRKAFRFTDIKRILILCTFFALIFSIYATGKSPNFSYYSLPTRAWEMLIGGLIALYPYKPTKTQSRYLELIGVSMLAFSFFYFTEETPWPGYFAILPVLGTCFIIQANRQNSFITTNTTFNRIGRWSYSIYLWHWPIVVALNHFALGDDFIYIGVFLSIIFGYLSYTFIEGMKFKRNCKTYKLKYLYVTSAAVLTSFVIYKNQGFINLAPIGYQNTIKTISPSPLRKSCHIDTYQSPSYSCEYFGNRITWATLGDSHTVELAYALAKKLKEKDLGLKHFSYSGCPPSYKQDKNFGPCSRWYNEAAQYILENNEIRNVVLNHRFSLYINDQLNNKGEETSTLKRESIFESIDNIVIALAQKKDNVYLFYPIPELPDNVKNLVNDKATEGHSLKNIEGVSLKEHIKRNKIIISHFKNANYPKNVILLDPSQVFCDKKHCFAVEDMQTLYFDDNHPSLAGAEKLVELF